MSFLITPFKVGLLIIVSAIAFVVFQMALKQSGADTKDAAIIYAYFNDASGLGLKSRVQTAGIPVGEVTDIRLDGTRAKLTLAIRRDVPLKTDAKLLKRSESMLGDYMIDLVPGSSDAPPLEDGGTIASVVDSTGIDEAVTQLNDIAGDIKEVTRSLREVFGSEKGANNMQAIVDNLTSVSRSLDRTLSEAGGTLNSALDNIDKLASDIRQITKRQGGNIEAVVVNLRDISDQAKEVLDSINSFFGNGEDALQTSIGDLKSTLTKLDTALKNVESITRKIDEGDGTLGRLINDEELGERLTSTVTDVSDYLGRAAGMAVEVSLRSEYLFRQETMKNTFGIKLIPKPDKYYLIEVIDDPRGNVSETTIRRYPPAADEEALQTVLTTDQSFKFSAQFAKRFYFATLRFGIIESTGGIGGNLNFFDDRLALSVDLFEFTTRDVKWPRFRAGISYSFLNHLKIHAGVDDLFNAPQFLDAYEVADGTELTTRKVIRGRDWYVGAGFFFTDEDFKSLLSALPKP